MCLIEWKVKFKIFSILIFRVMVIFVLKTPQLIYNSIQHIAHLSSKREQNWGRGGEGLHILSWEIPDCSWALVRGIIVETFISRIKVSNFGEMFVLGCLLRKNMASREIQTLTLAGAIKRGRKGRREGIIYRTFVTFHPVDKIAQNLVCRRKMEK